MNKSRILLLCFLPVVTLNLTKFKTSEKNCQDRDEERCQPGLDIIVMLWKR